MRRGFRSISALIAVVALAGLGMAALRHASTHWSSALFTLDLALLGLALIASLVGRGATRGCHKSAARP